jgi:hypothetical protein
MKPEKEGEKSRPEMDKTSGQEIIKCHEKTKKYRIRKTVGHWNRS